MKRFVRHSSSARQNNPLAKPCPHTDSHQQFSSPQASDEVHDEVRLSPLLQGKAA